MENIIDLLKRYDALQNRALAQEMASSFQPAPDLQEEQKLSIINNITQGNAGIGSYLLPKVSTTYPVSATPQQPRQETYTWSSAGPVWSSGGGWSDPGAIRNQNTTAAGIPIRWPTGMENVATASGPMPGTPGGYSPGGGATSYGKSQGAAAASQAGAAAGRFGAPSGYVDPRDIARPEMSPEEYQKWLTQFEEAQLSRYASGRPPIMY